MSDLHTMTTSGLLSLAVAAGGTTAINAVDPVTDRLYSCEASISSLQIELRHLLVDFAEIQTDLNQLGTFAPRASLDKGRAKRKK